MLSYGSVERTSAMLAAHDGISNPTYSDTRGETAVAATSWLMSSLAARYLSWLEPWRTTPSNVYMKDMAASLICRAPLTPCYATVCPNDYTLTAG